MLTMGDIYQVTTHDNLIVIGVVQEPTKGNGYFEGWEICAGRTSGRLMQFALNGRFEGPEIIKLVPQPATAPTVTALVPPMPAPAGNNPIDALIRACEARVDRAFELVRGGRSQEPRP
jgi:hypothetical protein